MTAVATTTTTDLERFLEVIWREGDVREVRIPGGPRGTDSGYFDDTAKLASAVAPYDGRANVYITINPVEPALLARAANRIAGRARTTTADADVVRRRWLPIDLDPKRPTGISASEVEREHALATARAVYTYLNELGWPDPVTTMSGNGYWLLYPIDVPNDDPGKQLVEGVLGHLAGKFGSAAVSIDTTVANAARIVALIGTVKTKGDPTPERPHRRSVLSFCPPDIVPVPHELLAALAGPGKAITPTTAKPPFVSVGRMPAGWVRKLLDDAGVGYRESERGGRTWYQLEQCPFHPDDDQGGDCGVGEDPDGKGLGHCFHNRGAGKGWQEFKSALGLDTKILPFPVAPVQRTTEPAFPTSMDAADLLTLDLPPLRWIVPNLIPEGTTILAAPPKVGKSCLIYQVAVEASIGGDLLDRRVAPGSVLYMALEDGRRRGQDRLRAVLAGRTMPRGRLEVRWSAPPIGQGLEEEIAAWLNDHPDAVMVAIDTLGKVRPAGGSRQRNAYEVDVEHLSRLQALFRNVPVALLIVHHSSKEKRDDFLASVSGTYGITGSADTIIVVERKRSEAFGQIHVTGRDAPDASIPARFDGLLWQTAPQSIAEGRFERTEAYRVIEAYGPIFPMAIAEKLGKERTAIAHMVAAMVADGDVVRVDKGYVVNRVDVSSLTNVTHPTGRSAETPLMSPLTNTTQESGMSEGGDTHARAAVRAPTREDAEPVSVTPTPEATLLNACFRYEDHTSRHRQTPDGWTCDACHPPEGAS